MSRSRALLIASLVTSALAACTPALVRPETADVRWVSERWPGTTLEDLAHGREVFVDRCAGCHNLPQPSVKTPDQWAGVLDEMARGARLSSNDKDLVLRYLASASERTRRQGG